MPSITSWAHCISSMRSLNVPGLPSSALQVMAAARAPRGRPPTLPGGKASPSASPQTGLFQGADDAFRPLKRG